MFMNSLSVSTPSTLSRKTRGSPGRVKQGGSKKSFGINNRHSLGKGEKTVVKKKSEKDSRRLPSICRVLSVLQVQILDPTSFLIEKM